MGHRKIQSLICIFIEYVDKRERKRKKENEKVCRGRISKVHHEIRERLRAQGNKQISVQNKPYGEQLARRLEIKCILAVDDFP